MNKTQNVQNRENAGFNADVLKLDVEQEVSRITSEVQRQVYNILKKRGAVVGISGGVDSAVTASLLVRALGSDRVVGIHTREEDVESESSRLARKVAGELSIDLQFEDITPVLEAAGSYARRDEAVRNVYPGYTKECKIKLVLPEKLYTRNQMKIYKLVVQDPDGERHTFRLDPQSLMEIIAATNQKQRIRKLYEYYHAERRNYAVTGTANRIEYDQGFFVKGGDGLADLKPIAHLYKTQIFMLAEYLELPEEILNREPSTDTYSLSQSQEEFFFTLPSREFDLLLWALNHDVPPKEVAGVLSYTSDEVEQVYRHIETTRDTSTYLHTSSLSIEPVNEVGAADEQPAEEG